MICNTKTVFVGTCFLTVISGWFGCISLLCWPDNVVNDYADDDVPSVVRSSWSTEPASTPTPTSSRYVTSLTHADVIGLWEGAGLNGAELTLGWSYVSRIYVIT